MKKNLLFFGIFISAINLNAQHNVMLIIADDLGTDWCGFYEDHVDTVGLPHIRTLLSKGVRFQNAMSNPWCSSTRAGIFTGRYSFRTGVGAVVGECESLDTGEISIPRLLKIYNPDIGTAQIGKWHLQTNTNSNWQYPNLMGYDYYAGSFKALTDYYNWKKITNGVKTTITNYATTEEANEAISWINTQTQKPFFLWLAFHAPHGPYHLPPAGFYSDTTLSGTALDIQINTIKYFKADLEALDHEIGRLFDSLQFINKLDSTDIIFIGDNGNAQPTVQIVNNKKAKGTLYNYGTHVPFIISGPSVVNPGRVSGALVNTADLFATILGLFGDTAWQSYIPANKPVDSKSILPIIKDKSMNIRPWAFTEIFKYVMDSTCGKAMRNKNYKLLNFDYDNHQEFYKLTNDTNELNNLLSGSLDSIKLANYSYLCTQMNILTGSENYCHFQDSVWVGITATATFICSGTPVTFTATAANAGIAPTYQWKKNGSNVGTGSNSYTDSMLANGDSITCVVTTASFETATSNCIKMYVTPTVTPSVSITATSSAICTGTPVTFHATPVNGGTFPSYQWKKNGNNVGGGNSSYTPNTLVNGNVISCVLTSNAACTTSPTAISNSITMTVNNNVPKKPSVISGIHYSLCNTSANYTYTVSPVNNVTYVWSVPSNTTIVSGQGTSSLVLNYSSLFVSGVISVQASNYCGLGAARTLNAFARPPTPGPVTGPATVCANQQNISYSVAPVMGATSYKWTLPAGSSFVSGKFSNTPVINFGTTSGNVTVLAKNSCANSAKSILAVTINCRTGDEGTIITAAQCTENKYILSVISPFTDAIIFSINSDLNNAVVSLFDITGREIYQRKNISLTKNKQEYLTADRNIPAGVYLLTIKNSEAGLISKIIHQ